MLNLSSEFSPYPAGRTRRDGQFSGERFRDDYLWPRLQNNSGTIRLSIDGVAGLPSSFWEEVFGGLVRRHHMRSQQIKDRVKIETSDDELRPYVQLAYRFAEEADRAA